MGKVKVQFFITVFILKLKKKYDFNKFSTYDKYTLYKYEMHVKITYIYKDKAQVILFKKVIPHIMFKEKRWCFNCFLKISILSMSRILLGSEFQIRGP